MQTLTTSLGTLSGTVTVFVVFVQIRMYGFKRWLKLGAGTGMTLQDVEKEEEELREEVEHTEHTL